MFCGASAFTSDLSGWDVGRVEGMEMMHSQKLEGMFQGASAIQPARDAPWYKH